MYIYTHIRVYILACDLQTFISDHSRNEESLPFLIWDQMNKIILQSMENWQSQVFYLSFKIVTKICAPEHSRTFASAYEFACVHMYICASLFVIHMYMPTSMHVRRAQNIFGMFYFAHFIF